MNRMLALALVAVTILGTVSFAQAVGTRDNPIMMVLAPSMYGAEVVEIGERITEALFDMTGFYIETVFLPDLPAMVEAFASSDGNVFGFPASADYLSFFESTGGDISLRLIALYHNEWALDTAAPSDSVFFGPGFPRDIEDILVEAIKAHIETPDGLELWSNERFYGWTGVADASESFLFSLQAAVGLAIPSRLCTTDTAPPSGTEPEDVIRYVEDPIGDYELDHPMFAELYGIVFEENTPIPPSLDIVEVTVDSNGEFHTFQLRTREGGVLEEMRNVDQRISLGVYIDSDGNGVSDYILTTAANGERSVILTSDFEPVDAVSELMIDGDIITMTIPEWVTGAGFHWMAFSGYSPNAYASYTTAIEDVFVVPDVDVVSSIVGMTSIISFLEGPGGCQIVNKISVGCCGGTCAKSVSVPYTTVPGTTKKGRLFYRKQCGTRIYEFWCVGCCFGSRVYGGGTTGWVGRCPYPCGYNSVNVWSQFPNTPLHKIYHTVRDASCASLPDMLNPLKHEDSSIGGTDGKMDSMQHTYLYATDQLISCNIERQPGTNAFLNSSCCPNRKPYVALNSVPGRIDNPASDCPTSP